MVKRQARSSVRPRASKRPKLSAGLKAPKAPIRLKTAPGRRLRKTREPAIARFEAAPEPISPQIEIPQAPAHAEERNIRHRDRFNFPQGYGDNRITLLVRDPWWIFAYWEVRFDKEEEVLRRIESAGDQKQRSVLRVYDVTDVHFNGRNAHAYFDIDLSGLANSWYINVGKPDRSWIVDIGIVTRKGDFYLLARSNAIRTPRFGMSDQLDAEWMVSDDEYWRLFSLSGGFGLGKGSFEVREQLKRQLEEQLSSGALSSGASVFKRHAERKFWLVVNCELIVYGATEHDAKVTMQGKPISLRPDGTFSMRFALPDGKQTIPVEATSSDGVDKRRITPIVTRKTE